MSAQNNGGPAFPIYDHHCDGQQFLAETGMTLRDYFAAKALAGLLSSGEPLAQVKKFSSDAVIEGTASAAYAMADAMLKARSA